MAYPKPPTKPSAACCPRCRPSASASRRRSIRAAARQGVSILWLQLPEAPRFIKGDAAGEIAMPADGRWTEAVREKFADRIEAILAAHIEISATTSLRAKPIRRATLKRSTSIWSAAILTADSAASTNFSSGGRSTVRSITARRSRGCITSAPRPIRARGSAAARVTCWRNRCTEPAIRLWQRGGIQPSLRRWRPCRRPGSAPSHRSAPSAILPSPAWI